MATAWLPCGSQYCEDFFSCCEGWLGTGPRYRYSRCRRCKLCALDRVVTIHEAYSECGIEGISCSCGIHGFDCLRGNAMRHTVLAIDDRAQRTAFEDGSFRSCGEESAKNFVVR